MFETTFLHLLSHTLESTKRSTRNGMCLSRFDCALRVPLDTNFPLITTRKLFFRGIFEELLWMLRGETDTKELAARGVHVWDGNATKEFIHQQGLDYEEGRIGPSYGWQFRHFGANYPDTLGGHDQLREVIRLLRDDPSSRRILINLWNVSDLDKMVLPPCGFCYQFYVEDNTLSCKVTQRSSDISLAGGWNIASGSLFTCLLAHTLGMKPGFFSWSVGDYHIYENQIPSVQEQVKREPRPLPRLSITRPKVPKTATVDDMLDYICSFTYKDIQLDGYKPHPRLPIHFNP